ncbi:MAG: serine/threonine protein kinase [Deltaproteobacteria bacterium]|nr:serine/threonine protein kinase [Deltaproteobacteria bacterium]
MAAEDRSQELPWARVGPYRLLCELGRGSMAVVYLGRAEGPGGFERLCALKMIHSHLSQAPEFVDLFLNEARIAARIHHPNVISVDDIALHEGRYYLRMDYVSGETLFQALNRTWNEGHAFPLPVAAQIISAVSDGLHAAHELKDASGAPLGVIHRDLGPHNILIGYDGVVRVMDFGIAKALDQVTLTQPGTWRGTAAFMSPEQVRGEQVDRRGDIFSLGVVLWETTVGARLFKHTTMAGTMARILNLAVPLPSALREGYPPRLEQIVLRCLERDPDKRYSTARELSEDLVGHLIEAGVTPATGSIERFMRETFQERHGQRLEMEQEARVHDHTGRLKSVLRAPPPTELRIAVVEPEDRTEEAPKSAAEKAAAKQASTTSSEAIGRALNQPAAVPRAATVDPSEAPTGIAVRPRTEPSFKKLPLQRRGSLGRDFKLAAVLLGLGAVAAILLILVLGRHTPPPEPPVAMVRLSFQVEPAHALVSIDGNAQEGDLVVPLSPQEYRVEVAAEGYLTQTLVVSAEASREIEVNLEPAPKRATRSKVRPKRRTNTRGR